MVIARKLSLEMKALLKQVKFNIVINSMQVTEVRNVGLKLSTVRLVTNLVIIFIAHYRTQLHIWICNTLNLCKVSEREVTATSLLLLANSTLNPFVYAFLKEDVRRESKAFLCCKGHVKLRVLKVYPE